MKIKDLKKLIENFNDNDEVGIEINGEIYDCYGYDHEYARNEMKIPTLVIAQE